MSTSLFQRLQQRAEGRSLATASQQQIPASPLCTAAPDMCKEFGPPLDYTPSIGPASGKSVSQLYQGQEVATVAGREGAVRGDLSQRSRKKARGVATPLSTSASCPRPSALGSMLEESAPVPPVAKRFRHARVSGASDDEDDAPLAVKVKPAAQTGGGSLSGQASLPPNWQATVCGIKRVQAGQQVWLEETDQSGQNLQAKSARPDQSHVVAKHNERSMQQSGLLLSSHETVLSSSGVIDIPEIDSFSTDLVRSFPELEPFRRQTLKQAAGLGVDATKLEQIVNARWPAESKSLQSAAMAGSVRASLSDEGGDNHLMSPSDLVVAATSSADHLEAQTYGSQSTEAEIHHRNDVEVACPGSSTAEQWTSTLCDNPSSDVEVDKVISGGVENELIGTERPIDRHGPELMPTLLDVMVKLASCSNEYGVKQVLCKLQQVLVPSYSENHNDLHIIDAWHLNRPTPDHFADWQICLARLESQLQSTAKDAEDRACEAAPQGVLHKAQEIGSAVGRALQILIDGVPQEMSTALTLSEELMAFATAAANGCCGVALAGLHRGALTPGHTSEAAADMWKGFGGVEEYAKYLSTSVAIPHADVPLSGGAAWRRLISEVEVAMMLVQPPQDDLERARVHCTFPGQRGGQDLAPHLMNQIMYPPLLQRIRYVAARVAWSLERQHLSALEWMKIVKESPQNIAYSKFMSASVESLKNPFMHTLVNRGLSNAVVAGAIQLLDTLQNMLTAGCQSPHLLTDITAKPHHDLDEFLGRAAKACTAGEASSWTSLQPHPPRATPLFDAELLHFQFSAPGPMLPEGLHRSITADDATSLATAQALQSSSPYDSKDLARAKQRRQRVRDEMRKGRGLQGPPLAILTLGFSSLRRTLTSQATALVETTLQTFRDRLVDEAFGAMTLSEEQRVALEANYIEFCAPAQQTANCLQTVQKCIALLQSVQEPSSQPSGP